MGVKELSNEEKARRYDEAIERAKNYYSTTDSASDIKLIGLIFPELKECEDERIRKKIIQLVNDAMATNAPYKKEMLAWLEKLSEQPKKHDVCDNCDQQGSCVSPCPMKLVEKQGEQKPVNRLKITAGNWYVCEMEVMNENMVTAFHRDEIYYCPKDGYLDVRGALFEVGCLDVFRLATEKEIPQPKQEWSEEDKVMLDEIIDFFENGTVKLQHDLSLYASWLKFIKNRVQPQDTWKPSDEQMKALSAINVTGGISYAGQGQELINLYNDLKKLKE